MFNLLNKKTKSTIAVITNEITHTIKTITTTTISYHLITLYSSKSLRNLPHHEDLTRPVLGLKLSGLGQALYCSGRKHCLGDLHLILEHLGPNPLLLPMELPPNTPGRKQMTAQVFEFLSPTKKRQSSWLQLLSCPGIANAGNEVSQQMKDFFLSLACALSLSLFLAVILPFK